LKSLVSVSLKKYLSSSFSSLPEGSIDRHSILLAYSKRLLAKWVR
jgi:hypothetical protein